MSIIHDNRAPVPDGTLGVQFRPEVILWDDGLVTVDFMESLEQYGSRNGDWLDSYQVPDDHPNAGKWDDLVEVADSFLVGHRSRAKGTAALLRFLADQLDRQAEV